MIYKKVSISGFLLWVGTQHSSVSLTASQFKAAKLLVDWIQCSAQYMKNTELARRNLNDYVGQIMSTRDKEQVIPLFLAYLESLNHNDVQSTRGHLGDATHNKR